MSDTTFCPHGISHQPGAPDEEGRSEWCGECIPITTDIGELRRMREFAAAYIVGCAKAMVTAGKVPASFALAEYIDRYEQLGRDIESLTVAALTEASRYEPRRSVA